MIGPDSRLMTVNSQASASPRTCRFTANDDLPTPRLAHGQRATAYSTLRGNLVDWMATRTRGSSGGLGASQGADPRDRRGGQALSCGHATIRHRSSRRRCPGRAPGRHASALGAVTTIRDAQGMEMNGAPRSRSQRSVGAATTGSADTKEAWTAARPSQGCSPCDSR